MLKTKPAGLLSIVPAIALAMALAGCSTANGAENSKIRVAATFYPIYDIAKKIGGEKIQVSPLIPSGVEPHDYEPSPKDIAKLSKSKAFITIGMEFSNIENELINGVSGSIEAIDAAKGVSLLDAEYGGESGAEEKNEGIGKDTHIWISPKNMMIVSNNIKGGLKKIDPANSEYYEENANKAIADLQKLDYDFKNGLSSCKKNVILANHRAFSYLAKDYGFRQVGISGLMPETEPTPKEIIRIKGEAIKNNVKYIFTEKLADARVAETIANEIGAKILVLDPIEGSSSPSDDYFSLMRKNLANLRLALECS